MRFSVRVALALSITFGGCDGNLGCTACGAGVTYPDPPPAGGRMLPATLAAQLQESGARFFIEHLADLLRSQFPTRTAGGIERAIIYLPSATIDGAVSLTLRDGCMEEVADLADCPTRTDPGDETGPTYRSRIELNLDTIDETIDVALRHGAGTQPDSVRVTLFDVDLFLDLGVMIQGGVLGDATCWVKDTNLGEAGVHLDQLQFTVSLQVDANDAFFADVTGVETEVSDLIQLDVAPCNAGAGALPALCDDPTCHDGWISFECGFYCGTGDFIFTAASWIDSFLAPIVEWALPPVIESMMASALEPVNGSPLAMAAHLPVAGLFGGQAPLLMDPTTLEVGAFPNADAFQVRNPTGDRGLLLSLDAATGAAASACVPTVTVPRFEGQIGALPLFDGRIQVDGQPEAYHLVLALARAFVSQALHSAYRVGALCWQVDSEDLEQLTGGAISLGALALLVPSLAEIGEARAPLLFQIHPTAVPTVRFGSGDVVGTDEDGNAIVDSLLQVDLGEVGLSIYAFADDTYLRLATVAADVRVGVPVVRTPHNTLELGVDGFEMTNVVEVYNEALGSVDFAELFEVMISVALSSLLGGVGSIDLDIAPVVSSMVGGAPIFARINDVRREGGADNGYLVAYVTLCDEEDLDNPDLSPCYTPVPAPPVPRPRVHDPWPQLPGARPVVALAVDAGGEYQVRVDNTYWGGFVRAPGGVLDVRHPLLRVPGVHQIELRRREPGAYWTRQGEASRVEVIVE